MGSLSVMSFLSWSVSESIINMMRIDDIEVAVRGRHAPEDGVHATAVFSILILKALLLLLHHFSVLLFVSALNLA